MANLRVDKITSTETFETTGSVQFDASSGTGLVVGSSDCDFGTGDFTIEGWFLVQDSAAIRTIFDSRTSDNATTGLFLGINTDDTLYTYGFPSGTLVVSYGTPEPNTWHHVAVVRNGSDGLVFLDGKLVSSGVKMGSSDYTQEGGTIGQPATSFAAGLYRFKGHISNLRVIKGTALYTSNFKPSMRELEVTAETVLLACQSKTDASLEKTGKTITVNGNAVANELTPGLLTDVVKSGAGSAITGSVEFDGDDYIELPTSSDFSFSEDFTVEAWAYPTDVTSDGSNSKYKAIFTLNVNGGWNHEGNGLVLSIGNLHYQGVNNNYNAGIISINTWTHLAVTRSNGAIRIFINGSLDRTIDNANSDDVLGNGTGNIPAIGLFDKINGTPRFYFTGYISNVRVINGKALYTDNFIPPTRELKKVPGTVLLACQDPDNPLTEAIGKTITGYGDFDRVNVGEELITNGDFTSNTDNWTANGATLPTLSVDSGRLKLTHNGANGGAYQNITTVVGSTYDISAILTDGNSSGVRLRVYGDGATGDGFQGTNYIGDSVTDATPTFRSLRVVAETTTTRVYIEILGSSTQYAFADVVKAVKLDPGNRASNFTPQVGDDRKVTFEGVTKINSDAYFYLPTGDTASREATGTYNAGTRAVYHSGEPPTTSTYDTLEYLTIASLGSVADFGNLTNQKLNQVSCSSNTRGLFGTGYTPSPASGNNFIDYVTIMSTGNAQDFGDLTYVTYVPDACSNQIRGIYAGGAAAPNYAGLDNIDYVTIASKGNGQDFGNLTDARHSLTGLASPTRGIFGAGQTNVNTIEYITIASTGNASDFGDLLLGRAGCAGASSSIRGLFAGGYTASPNVNNIIEFITIASMGNSQDFGDLTAVRRFAGATSSTTRGVFIAGYNPSATNTIDFVSIQTTGNATDFGDTTINKTQSSACSNGHGGLG